MDTFLSIALPALTLATPFIVAFGAYHAELRRWFFGPRLTREKLAQAVTKEA